MNHTIKKKYENILTNLKNRIKQSKAANNLPIPTNDEINEMKNLK